MFASRLTEHSNFAEIVWKLVRLFPGIEPIVVSSSCKKSHVPIVVSPVHVHDPTVREYSYSYYVRLQSNAHFVEKLS